MKCSALTAIVAVLTLAPGTSRAAIDPVELKVIGTLDVPPCTVAVTDDGKYDLGDLAPSTIKPGTATTALPKQTKHWTVTCEGDTYLTYRVVDNQPGTETDVQLYSFGLGKVNTTGKIGFYRVETSELKVDGKAAHYFATSRGVIGDNKGPTGLIYETVDMGWAETGTNTQMIGKVFETDLTVAATIAGSQTMNGPIAEDVPVNGSLTLSFAYGL